MYSDGRQRAILVIDDEPQVIEAISDILEDDFRILPTTSAEEALRMIEANTEIAVVLCDQRMPKMTGDELLSRAKEISSATRILITGYADLQAVIRAVNDGRIFGYISKPWDPASLRTSVNKAVEYHDLLGELEKEQALLRNLMRFSPDGIIFKDENGHFLRVNAPILEYLGGLAEEDVLGKSAADLLPPERAKVLIESDALVFQTRRPALNVENVVTDRDGRRRWYSLNKSPIVDHKDEIVGLVEINRDITDLRRAEEEAKQLGTRLRDAVESMQDGFTLFDADGQLVLSNHRFSYLAPGFDAISRCGADFPTLLRYAVDNGLHGPPEYLASDFFEQCLSHFHRADGSAMEVPTSDGRWHLMRAQRTSDGGTVVIRNDITALKESERRLDRRAKEQETVARFGQVALGNANLSTVYQSACDEVARLLNVPLVNILERQPDGALLPIAGTGWEMGDHRGDHGNVPDQAPLSSYAIETGKPVLVNDWSEERRFECPDFVRNHGVRSSFAVPIVTTESTFGALVVDSVERAAFSGDSTLALTAIANILGLAVHRDRATKALAVSESRFRHFAQCSADWFWETDTAQRFTYLSGTDNTFDGVMPRSGSSLGRSRRELIGPVNPSPDPIPLIQAHMEGGEAFSAIEYVCHHPVRGEFWASLSGVPVTDDDGRVTHYRGVGSDISARKTAENALRRSVERFELAARASSAGLWDWDMESGAVYYAPRFGALLGLPEEAIVEKIDFLRDRVHQDDIEHVTAALDGHLTARHEFDVECRLRRHDGEWRWFRLIGEAVFQSEGVPSRMCGWAQDVTDARLANEQLRQAQKMDAIGNLTGGVAHDFNNMLTIVLGNLDLLAEMVSDDPKKLELVSAALHAGERSEELTRQLLTFSRRQSLSPSRVSVNDLVSGMVKLLGRTIGPAVEIRLELGESVWPVRVDPSQLESALANLAVNARDAMPEGGSLTFRTLNVSADIAYASQRLEMEPGDYVRLDVSDTGTGIPPEIRPRIFEPFFTTKGVGKGTGLGLAMVFGFIKQSGGHVAVYSEVGLGTTFHLYLPRIERNVEGIAGVRTAETALRAVPGETVLVVDDESGVRKIAVTQLQGLGYEVLEAEDGASALAQLQRSVRIDLLFTDVAMPGGMYGPELAERALALRPELKVLLTSGFVDAGNGAHKSPENRFRIVNKPFRQDALATAIRAELDREDAS